MKFDIQKLHTWNILVRVFFMILVFVAIFFACYKFIIEDERSSLDASIDKVNNLKKTYSTNKANVANLKQIQDEVNSLQDVLNGYLKYLPSEVEMPKLMRDTSKVADGNNVRFASFSPVKDIKEKKAYYITKPIDATFDVNFYDIVGFMQGVTGLERIVNVNSFSMESSGNSKSIKKGDGSDLLRVKMQLRTYIFSKEVNK